MVDTGPGPRAAAPQHYRPGDPDHLLPLELARHGIDPLTVTTVILTHLHNDHVGDVRLFPNATFHVQLAELQEAVCPVPFQRAIYEVNQPGHLPPWVHILGRYVAQEGDGPIMPGISTLTLPGHTSGSQGVLVDTASGPFLLPGDLVPLRENWPGDGTRIPNGNHTDPLCLRAQLPPSREPWQTRAALARPTRVRPPLISGSPRTLVIK